MASFNRKEPIHWCTSVTPGTNPMRLKRKAIGPAGQVVEISLATGKTITNHDGNSYKDMILREKKSRDWVWYEECPADCGPVAALENMQRDGDEALCETCAKREALIRARVEAKGRANADYARMFETNLDKLAKVLEQNMVGTVAPKLTDEQLANAMATAPVSKKRRKGVHQ